MAGFDEEGGTTPPGIDSFSRTECLRPEKTIIDYRY